MNGWDDKPLVSRINDCVLGLSIGTGFMSMSALLALIFYDNEEWMGCVLSLVAVSISVYVLLFISDRYEIVINEVEE